METEQTIRNWKENYKTELNKSRSLLNFENQPQWLAKDRLEKLLKDSIVIKEEFSKLMEDFFIEHYDRINSSNTGHKDEYNLYQWAESCRVQYGIHQNYENQITYEIQQSHNDRIISDAEKSLIKSRNQFFCGIGVTVLFSIVSVILNLKSCSDSKVTESKIDKIQTTIEIIQIETEKANRKINSITDM
jgi:hypothetical protein